MTLLEKIVVECVVFSDGTTNASLRLHETENLTDLLNKEGNL